MAITGSGPIKLSDLQLEFGGSHPISMSEYYKGGTNVASDLAYTNYSTPISGANVPNVPTSGNSISLGSDFYSSGNALVYTGSYNGGDTTPVKTGFGFSLVQASFNPATYIGTLTAGDTFLVCCANTTDWPYGWHYADYDSAILACTYGTSSSIQAPQVYGKQWRPAVTYDGANSVTIYGQYSGSNTNFGAGQNFLQGIVRTS